MRERERNANYISTRLYGQPNNKQTRERERERKREREREREDCAPRLPLRDYVS